MCAILLIFPIIREAFEEVVVKQIADFEEQVGVNPGMVEDFVHILAREIELFGEPCYGAALFLQLRFDKVSYVRFVCHAIALLSLGRSKQKRA